ncbi:MAG: AraC family transcriptional regulator [Bacillota bacterium]|nr:AraC family transcriptional regulator [Bacillota bacterium]
MIDEKLLCKTPAIDVSFKSISVEHMEPLEHYHDTCEIALFVRADVNVFLKDRQYAIRDGDLLFIDAYEIHKIIYTEGKDYSRYVLNFSKSCLQDILALLGVADILQSISRSGTRRIRLNLKQCDRMKDRLDELIKDNQKKDKAGAINRSVLARMRLKLCELIIDLHSLLQKADASCPDNTADTAVRKVLYYLDTMYMNPITLELLEKEFTLSKYHLAHRFKAVTGLTVIGYLQLKRVIEAQKSLRQSTQSITDICYDCGFNNVQHFYRVFKKVTRQTPLAYRQTNLPFPEK